MNSYQRGRGRSPTTNAFFAHFWVLGTHRIATFYSRFCAASVKGALEMVRDTVEHQLFIYLLTKAA